MRPAVAVVLGVALAACGPRRPAPVAPETYLSLGVDPTAECDAERDTLSRDGLREVRRVTGPGVCAIGLASADGRRTAVRIVTSRGVVVARDGDADAVPATAAYTLVPPPAGSPASREVLLGRREGARTCVAVVRIVSDDSARVVDVHTATIVDRVPPAQELCIEALRDVDGDGRLDALVVVRLDGLALGGATAEVAVPLSAQGDVLAPSLALGSYWITERSARDAALSRARAGLDVATASRLAVELAAIALLAGDGRDAAVHAFDDALRGLVLDEAQARAVEATRTGLAEGLAPAH